MSCDPKNLPKIKHDGNDYYVVAEFHHPLAADIFMQYVDQGKISIEDSICALAETNGVKREVFAVRGADCYCHLCGLAQGLDVVVKTLKAIPELRTEIDADWETSTSA